MRSSILFAILAASLLIAGCDRVPEPIGVEPDGEPVFSRGVAATATGGGVFDAGLPVDFHGEVICMTSDPAHRRAWIGGVITANRSEPPAFTRDLHQAGRDIWFRVVDYGQGSSASQPDRTTFVGFEGGGGIATSLALSQPGTMERGPPEERTGPDLEGNIRVGR